MIGSILGTRLEANRLMNESEFEKHMNRHPIFYWIVCLIVTPIIALPVAKFIWAMIDEERARHH